MLAKHMQSLCEKMVILQRASPTVLSCKAALGEGNIWFPEVVLLLNLL